MHTCCELPASSSVLPNANLQVERVTRESNFYPPERVKTFLMEVRQCRHCIERRCIKLSSSHWVLKFSAIFTSSPVSGDLCPLPVLFCALAQCFTAGQLA